MGQLDGKVVIVTGAAQGMGASHARTCAKEGARVLLSDIQEEAGAKLSAEIGGDAVFLRHDVSSESDWDAVVATALDRFGAVDALVNNAAIHHLRTVEQENAEDFRRMLDVNVVGTFLGILKCIAPMRAAGGGSIVNISSIAGIAGIHYHAAYGASKWAVRGLTKTAANELGPDNIRVNSVHPGGIENTGMFPFNEKTQADIRNDTPLRRAGRVEEISSMVVFLASDASAYITGTEHVIDGGRSLWR